MCIYENLCICTSKFLGMFVPVWLFPILIPISQRFISNLLKFSRRFNNCFTTNTTIFTLSLFPSLLSKIHCFSRLALPVYRATLLNADFSWRFSPESFDFPCNVYSSAAISNDYPVTIDSLSCNCLGWEWSGKISINVIICW